MKKVTPYQNNSFIMQYHVDSYDSISTFVIKIYNILNNPENASVICWHNDNKSFIIKNMTQLTNQILPHYFRHNNYQSFIRQLNMYNFIKMKDQSIHRYEHPYFIRERQDLLKYIRRKPQKKKKRQSDDSISFQKEQFKQEIVSVKSIAFNQKQNMILVEEERHQQAHLPIIKKKVQFKDVNQVENSQENISTIIEATRKWINNKDQNCWSNIQSFKSIDISMKFIDHEESQYGSFSGKNIQNKPKPYQNPIILLFEPNISEKIIKNTPY